MFKIIKKLVKLDNRLNGLGEVVLIANDNERVTKYDSIKEESNMRLKLLIGLREIHFNKRIRNEFN